MGRRKGERREMEEEKRGNRNYREDSGTQKVDEMEEEAHIMRRRILEQKKPSRRKNTRKAENKYMSRKAQNVKIY